jgi:hypothetical protein
VGADYVGASADLVRHLHALGHRRILYVREPDEAVAATDRAQGFLAGLAAVALPAGPDSVVRTDGSDLTVDQLHGWLDSGITAVVAEGTDTLAAARALQATAVAAGLRCPEDFSLALSGEQVYPEPGAQILTGFAVPRRAMGRDAVSLLVKLLEGDTVGDEERQQLLPCSPIQGETSGPPPAGPTPRWPASRSTGPTTQTPTSDPTTRTEPPTAQPLEPVTPELRTEVLIIGGGLGGVAAALAACQLGRQVILTEETDWVGGQLTAQAVPPDEHPWIEQFGCPASYRELRDRIRDYYRTWYPLTTAARSWRALNPGAGWVSKLCHEPRVALAVLEAMLAPHRAAGRLTVLLEHRAIGVSIDRDYVRAVELSSLQSGERLTVTAESWLATSTYQGRLPPT